MIQYACCLMVQPAGLCSAHWVGVGHPRSDIGEIGRCAVDRINKYNYERNTTAEL